MSILIPLIISIAIYVLQACWPVNILCGFDCQDTQTHLTLLLQIIYFADELFCSLINSSKKARIGAKIKPPDST